MLITYCFSLFFPSLGYFVVHWLIRVLSRNNAMSTTFEPFELTFPEVPLDLSANTEEMSPSAERLARGDSSSGLSELSFAAVNADWRRSGGA